jgi:Holliday junction resolvase
MPRRELLLQKEIVAFIKQIGGEARLCVQTPYTIVGDPDIYACFRGIFFQFEVKEEGEKPTKIQNKRRDEWMKAGARHYVVYSLEEVQRAINSVLANEDRYRRVR